MKFLFDSDFKTFQNFTVGGKAKNLFFLKKIGLNVPKFAVLPQEIFIDLTEIDKHDSVKETLHKIELSKIKEKHIERLLEHFALDTLFAVRSSAIDEDGSDFSFAGQFESYLFVPKEQLVEKIKLVWKSSCSERVLEYRKHHKISSKIGISVIIQEMVDAEVAGVAFGINPITGNRREKLISAVFGLGEGLVSGELNADNYLVTANGLNSEIVKKTELFVLDKVNFGTKISEIPFSEQEKATLDIAQIHELESVLNTCKDFYGKAQDIEFAFKNKVLYLLQARPITNLDKIPDISADYILWDNSNIIESYPGVTTPLTFSFISKSYEDAYKLFSAYMGVEEKVIKQHETVFQNTLGLINGRVYYNLKTWYHMLAMLPGYSINARYMEKMMGVKERFDIPKSYQLSKTKAWWSIVKMAFNMLRNLSALPRKRKAFKILLDEKIATYKAIGFKSKNANELMNLYLAFERELIQEWKAPLLNDFFAMIYFGRLQKICQKYEISSNPNIHNDLLCGSADIISTQPIHRSIKIASMVSENQEAKVLFEQENLQEIWDELKSNKNFSEIYLEIKKYIHDFGERCIGELKLETLSYNQDPTQFIRVIKSYVENKISIKSTSGKIEEQIRSNAENEVQKKLKNAFLKKRKLNKILAKTRELVSSRENLRYERTRAFGIVRELFSHIGQNFFAEGIISNDRDIFYLTKEEIFAFIEGRSVSANLKQLIAIRKEEFENYEKLGVTSERFATFGAVYHGNDFFSKSRIEALEGDLKGIGCCPGRVKAEVQVVLNPKEVNSLNAKILVTSSTDPGWVTLFPSASAIIVERGSLLSHSAIVSREMGIPCIVGVTGLLRTLKSGDIIEMDGSTGEIKIIEKSAD